MTLRLFSWICDVTSGIALGVLAPSYLNGYVPEPLAYRRGVKSHAVLSVALLYFFIKLIALLSSKTSSGKEKESMYGLEHGRLHVQAPTPMWMNMGYWRQDGGAQTLAEACRDLLKMVLHEADFEEENERAGIVKVARPKRLLIDVGFGCGEQTMYLMSDSPIRTSDQEWWDERDHCPRFDHYVGITNNATQHRYASKRIAELLSRSEARKMEGNISLFCADAAKPSLWNDDIKESIRKALENDQERWVMALDTAYHVSPSRWALIKYAYETNASFMAFDLCLSPTATAKQKLILRILTTLMRAPWPNFATPEAYKRRLAEIGYEASTIKIVDVSDNVFTSLAQFLDEQDARLKTLGFGIGAFGVAKSMFSWWGRSGVVRGIIVVARR